MALSLGKKDCCTNTYAMSSISLNLPGKTFPSLLLGQELLTHHCAEFPSQRPLPSISFIFPGSWGLLLSASIPWFLLSHSLPTLAQWLWPRSILHSESRRELYWLWINILPPFRASGTGSKGSHYMHKTWNTRAVRVFYLLRNIQRTWHPSLGSSSYLKTPQQTLNAMSENAFQGGQPRGMSLCPALPLFLIVAQRWVTWIPVEDLLHQLPRDFLCRSFLLGFLPSWQIREARRHQRNRLRGEIFSKNRYYIARRASI